MREGWICSRCKKSLSPDIKECGCSDAPALPLIPTYPAYPLYPVTVPTYPAYPWHTPIVTCGCWVAVER